MRMDIFKYDAECNRIKYIFLFIMTKTKDEKIKTKIWLTCKEDSKFPKIKITVIYEYSFIRVKREKCVGILLCI